MNNNYTIHDKSPSFLKIVPTWHFITRLISRRFELTEVVKAYVYFFKNYQEIELGKVYTFKGEKSSIRASLNKHNKIYLITGWNTSENEENPYCLKR